MKTILQGGRVLDPERGFDRIADVLWEGDRILAVGESLPTESAHVIDVRGKLVVPGLVDVHVHFREPGQEHKEDLATGARAAAQGGFTAVCCMPNTQPTIDQRSVAELIVRRSAELGGPRIHPVGAITRGLLGEHLTEMGELKRAGCVAVSDDGRPVMNAGLMRRALEYARTVDLLVVQHAEDLNLSQGGCMHEGRISTACGLRGQPAAAESAMVVRDLELVELTGARYHVAHVSTEASVRAIRLAKRRGLPVSCEVTPHHFSLTDEACATYDPNTKMAPPLRDERDRQAMLEGLADGTIDCIATDHAPHSTEDKEVEFEYAAFGVIGLETSFALGYELVRQNVLSMKQLVLAMTSQPAKLFGLRSDGITPGGIADLAVFDLEPSAVYDVKSSASRSRNSPFVGRRLHSQWLMTVARGELLLRGDA